MAATLTRAELDRLTLQLEGRIAKRLVSALEKAKQGIKLTKLEKAILDRNYAAAVSAIGRERVINALVAAQSDTLPLQADGWRQIADELPERLRRLVQVELSLGAYATQRPEVLEAIRRADLRRIVEIDRETERAIRDQITRGLERGIHPRDVARQLRDTLGLNRAQAKHVELFRQRLEGEGRDPAQVDRMVQREANRQAQQRAENIARTEAMSALNTGRQAQMSRLVRDQVINPEEWEQEWVVADDERLCPICREFDGVRADIGADFISNDFTRSKGPPVHPRCRCIVRLVPRDFRKGESTPRQLRRGVALRPQASPRGTSTRHAGSQATILEETPAERDRRIAFEAGVRRRKIEHGFSRLADGSELRYKGTASQIQFGTRQLQQLQGAQLFIHNHPRATPFSDVDLAFAVGNRIDVMRVVAHGPKGPVSYETDVGQHARLSPEAILLEFERTRMGLGDKYMAIFRDRVRRGMADARAADVTWSEHLHETWQLVSARLRFQYIRRFDRP